MILGLGFFGSAALAALFWRRRSAEKALRYWPQVRASIVPGTIVFQEAGRSFFGGRSGFRIVSAQFEYVVDDCSHSSRKVLPVNWTIREEEKERVQRELEAFAVALCNPADPAEAFLDLPDRWQRGSISWTTVGMVLAVCMTVVFGLLLQRFTCVD